MSQFNELEFKSYLWRSQLHEAVNYLRKFDDKIDLLKKYIEVFEDGQYYKRTDNEVIGNIDKIYQNYYRNVFWMEIPEEESKNILFQELTNFCITRSHLLRDGFIEKIIGDYIEDAVAEIVEAEGYEYLGGDTSGVFGPYIWKNSKKTTYEVELPSGIESYTIVMMDGFVSRSWLDFISFGKTGTGGWIGKDGTLCCVKESYDLESKEFNISFLKHEAQHAYDKKNYPNLNTVDLEYRAKLVELIYWPNDKIIKEIHSEADNSNPNNGHSIAAYRIINEMSLKLFKREYVNNEKAWEGKVDSIREYASELLSKSNNTLRLVSFIE